MRKKLSIIVDIDGTLANCDHRQEFVTNKGPWGKKDYDAFYQKMSEDTVHEHVLRIIQSCEAYHLIFVTGRPEKYRLETMQWLRRFCWMIPKEGSHQYAAGHRYEALHMRKDNDYRCDTIIKEAVYRKHIEPFYEVDFVLEDRDRVVKMWRSIGLKCLQVAEGNF